jgi:hypothetical protein
MLRRLLSHAMAIAAVVVFLTMPANSQGPADYQPHFCGTWLHTVPGMPVPALVTLNFGGTLNISSGFMFGYGMPTRLSPIHGVWAQTGPKRIAATSLFFIFNDAGVLTGYQRDRCILKFSHDFDSYEGTEYMETVQCSSSGCPDPLDPATEWTPFYGMPSNGFPVSAKRVKLVEQPVQ